MDQNRPYTFELAAIVLAEPGQHDEIKALAERNGVEPDQFERAIEVLKIAKRTLQVLTSGRGISPVGEAMADQNT
jgi:hypothetical protein